MSYFNRISTSYWNRNST